MTKSALLVKVVLLCILYGVLGSLIMATVALVAVTLYEYLTQGVQA